MASDDTSRNIVIDSHKAIELIWPWAKDRIVSVKISSKKLKRTRKLTLTAEVLPRT